MNDSFEQEWTFGRWRLQPRSRRLLVGNVPIPLGSRAFDLLVALVESGGELVTKDQLLRRIWPGMAVEENNVQVQVSAVRKALGQDAPEFIATIPGRGYRFIGAAQTGRSPCEPARGLMRPADASTLAANRAALLIVHAFECPDGDRSAVQFAHAMTSDLTIRLTRVEHLRIAATTEGHAPDGFRIRGEVRAPGGHFVVTVRLEGGSGTDVLWAERFDHPRAVPSAEEMVNALASSLERQVNAECVRRARQKRPSELTARDLCLLGRDLYHRGTEADTLAAQAMFSRSIAADPEYATAYSWQAYTAQRAVTHGWGSPTGQAARESALQLARRAVQIDEQSPFCLVRLAFSLVLHQRWEEAVSIARTAIRTRRIADYATVTSFGEVMTCAGYAEEALSELQRCLSLDPFCPPAMHAVLGRSLLLAGRPEESMAELRWCASRMPDYVSCFHSLVVAAVETGRMKEAVAARREVSRLQPGWAPRNHTGVWFFRRPSDLERFQAAFEATHVAVT